MGRNVYQQVGFVETLYLVGRGAGRHQAVAQGAVGCPQMVEEQPINPLQSFTVVKVLKGQIMAK